MCKIDVREFYQVLEGILSRNITSDYIDCEYYGYCSFSTSFTAAV